MDRAMLQGVLINETIEVLFECTGDFARATGARAIPQALGPLIGKALDPFSQGGVGKVESRGDSVDVVASDHRTDGLCTAKEAGLLRLFEHGL
jgi:hypothetical protein